MTAEAPSVERSPALTVSGLVERALEFDFTRPLAFAALAVAFVLSRVPWLWHGYGTDPDAWRVALTANYLWDHGEYWPSRLPGYPLHEFVTAAFIKGGAPATNFSTVLASLAGVWVFAQLVRELRLPAQGALTVAFAFAPLLWINSVTTMDYMWALTFGLAAYLAALRRRPLFAGALVGVAAGFRLTYLGMALPLALYLWRSGRPRDAVPLAAAATVVTAVAFAPVLWVYKLDFWNFYDQKVPWLNFLRLLGKDGLGLVGATWTLVALGIALPKFARLPSDLRREPHLWMWLGVIVLYSASFTRLPHEIAYLIPLFPFGFFLMGRYFPRWLLVSTLAVILLAGFVDLTSPGDDIDLEAFTNARVGKGMLLSSLETMDNQIDFANEVRDDIPIPEHSVVMMGFTYPHFAVLNHDRFENAILEKDYRAISMLSDRGVTIDHERDILYVWLLEYETFLRLKERGYRFFYVPDVARSTVNVFKYRPGYYGAEELPTSRESPSESAGAARTDR
ncbi:MAG TPA: hypothetical protein VNM43_05035 [Dehalococcoidia bacterium]|nr:hypothetical protein [Dehalococcoidia bacterium]